MREFNITGTCVPEKHYMVDTTDKLNQIRKLIDDGKYFVMNRARQYGKTTTFSSLFRMLKDDYLVIWLSFEGMGEDVFSSDQTFVTSFLNNVTDFLEFLDVDSDLLSEWSHWDEKNFSGDSFRYLSKKISALCKKSSKEIILFIDEVDKSSDNQIFLNFLGMLRNKYLKSSSGLDITFKSVVLAGVYDIKNLKLKMHSESERKYNSPWNIAADFTVDMSFSPAEISTMLYEYEKDTHVEMDIEKISHELYMYTNGYPFLVSRLCKWIDEDGQKFWTSESVRQAVKELLKTHNTLFDDLIKNIENYSELRELLTNILYEGREYSFTLANPVISLGVMFGILGEKNHMVSVSNLIFETYLYDYVSSIESMKDRKILPLRTEFIENGKLNMTLVLEKFQKLMHTEYRSEDETFIEKQARLLFLCFLKPIINGTGFYYVEPQTRDNTRMDIVINYGGEEFIVELKIWHGEKYRNRGIRQLESYLDSRDTEKGYLVSFSFLKKKQDTCGWISSDETQKKIFEIII